MVARRATGEGIERYDSAPPNRNHSGDVEALCFYAGQGVGLAGRVQPAAEIVAELASGAQDVLGRVAR